MPLAEQVDMIDQGDAGPITPGDLADHFRTQSYHLMERHPIVGAHLVLAAAALAPTCDDERDVAEEFSDLIADFAVEWVGSMPVRKRVASLQHRSSPVGFADRNYMRKGYRQRQGLGSGGKKWNDGRARVELDDGVSFGSANWGTDTDGWFTFKSRGPRFFLKGRWRSNRRSPRRCAGLDHCALAKR